MLETTKRCLIESHKQKELLLAKDQDINDFNYSKLLKQKTSQDLLVAKAKLTLVEKQKEVDKMSNQV